jgi:hypothetical protein
MLSEAKDLGSMQHLLADDEILRLRAQNDTYVALMCWE